ncbi:DUF6105 family protein [Tianweitania sediminis]|jgi:hypothetical protein|uniref:Transmembrane protein n=1 Tax=Tianweitania sediminis TaxID=1502156 RepID=A0A8J7R174_9HYPH|nr:DUF6105 family protein [Tianweitania sediminis]MBP0440798.1 hypothetical protein [Tianweitania sediminis]HEV7416709.1 DUF6105 family protein [Tianweitania sediminis]
MRYLLLFWALPLSTFWGWYGLSYNDMSFGFMFLSRPMHDLVFQIYGAMLNLDAASVPGLLAKACIIDTALILAIFAFRRRRQITGWLQARRDQKRVPTPSA